MSDAQNFEFTLPADPTWEPIEQTDTLEQDGIYAGVITNEKVNLKDGKATVIMTMTLSDADVNGRKIAKFMPDPRAENTQFVWRALARSAVNMDVARGGFTYKPGIFTGRPVYAKVESYFDDKGNRRTSVQSWLSKEEYDAAVKLNKHRWAPPQGPSGPKATGVPSGLPMSFPGVPATPPAPPAAAPLTPPAAPAQGFGFAPPAAPPVAPPAPPAAPAANPFAFPPVKS